MTIIFSDDFEAGAGTWVENVSGVNTCGITTDAPVNGTHNVTANVDNTASAHSEFDHTHGASNIIYIKAYIKIGTALPTGNHRYAPLGIFGSIGGGYNMVGVRDQGGTSYWSIEIGNGGAREQTISAYTAAINTWYTVVFYWKKDAVNGEAKCWVNDTLIASVSGKNTAFDGDMDSCWVGDGDSNSNPAHQVYVDTVIIGDNAYDFFPWTDGFEAPETSLFERWTGLLQISGVSTLEVSATHPLEGIKSLHSLVPGAETTAMARTWIYPNVASLHARCYAYFTAFGDPSDGTQPFTRVTRIFGTASEDSIASAIIVNDGGTPKFGLHWRQDAGVLHYQIAAGAPLPQLNTWYSLETFGLVSANAGQARLIVDNIEYITITGIDNSAIGQVTGFDAGINRNSATQDAELWIDNVVLAQGRIGVPVIGQVLTCLWK